MTTTKPTIHDRREAFAALFQAQYLQESHTDVAAHETYAMRLALLGKGSDDEVADATSYVSPNSSRFIEARAFLDQYGDNPTWGDYFDYLAKKEAA